MKKNGISSFGTTGASSIAVILAVLCLMVFSVLTLSEALANSRLSEGAAESVEEYYAAECAAQERTAQLRAEGKNGTYSFEVPVNDVQTLMVEVKISGDSYEILKWQKAYTADWSADDSIDVWKGGD